MTISNQLNKAVYTGNGVSTVFDYTFQILSAGDLVVKVFDGTSESTLSLNTNYTVQGVGEKNGGSITLTTALTNGYEIYLIRSLSLVQETDIRNQGPFHAEIHEDAFDRQTMVSQQLSEGLDRSLRLPLNVRNSGFSGLLPPDISSKPDSVLTVNSSGDGLKAGPSTSTIEQAIASGVSAAISETNAANSATASASSAAGSAASAVASAGSAVASANSATLAQNIVSGIVYNDVKFRSADFTILSSEAGSLFVVDASSGPINVTLPEIANSQTAGQNSVTFSFRKSDNSVNPVIITADVTDNIDQAEASINVRLQNSGLTLIGDTDTTPNTWVSVASGNQSGNSPVTIFSGDGATTTFTLPQAIFTENDLDVYISGVHQSPDVYVGSGNTIVFDTAPATGSGNIVVKQTAVLPIGTPSDGSVRLSSIEPAAKTTVSSPSKLVQTLPTGFVDPSFVSGSAQFPTQADATAAGFTFNGATFFNTGTSDIQVYMTDPAGDSSKPPRFVTQTVRRTYAFATKEDAETLSDDVDVDVVFNNVISDLDDILDGTGKINIKVAGLYLINFSTSMTQNGGAVNHYHESRLVLGGTASGSYYGSLFNANKYLTKLSTSTLSILLSLPAGATARVVSRQENSLSNSLVFALNGRNHISVVKVG